MNLNNLTTNEVWTFKLSSGEEVVAKVLAFNADAVSISHPVSVTPSQTGVGLMNTLFTANPKTNIELNTNSIAMIAHTDSDIKAQYLNATSKIVVPEKKLIMG